MGSYAVDSFHVNIGTGDGAIHLLVQSPDPRGMPDPDPSASSKLVIVRAALIDGGEPFAGGGAASIRDTIDNIKDRYAMAVHRDSGPGRMRFDSIMVTHWDSDHWGGVKTLLEDDFKEMFDADPSPTTADKKRNLETQQSRYCLYGDYKTTTAKTDLRTTFYAPYWGDDEKDYWAKKAAASGTKRTPTGAPAKAFKRDNPPALQREGAAPADFTLRFDYKIKAKRSEPARTAEIGRLCHFRSEVGDVIGSNILDNRNLVSVAASAYTAIDTPEKLVTALGGTQVDGGFVPVGIYCLASRGYVIGTDERFLQDRLIGGGRFFADDHISSKNQRSIACVVLWHQPDIKFSHYFAGDSWYQVENKVAAWISNGLKNRVHNMKLSHHGAVTSTPLAMLEALSPENIVISAGTDHCHPSWGSLLYLNAWLLKNGKEPRSIFVTRYPYYGDNNNTFQKEWFDHHKYILQDPPFTGYQKDFWQSMEDLYKSLPIAPDLYPGVTWAGLHGQAQAWFGRFKTTTPKREADTKRWFADQVSRAWVDNLSFLAPPDPTKIVTGKPLESDDKILYVWVRSSRAEGATESVVDDIGVYYRGGTTGFRDRQADKAGAVSTAIHTAGTRVGPPGATASRFLYPDVDWDGAEKAPDHPAPPRPRLTEKADKPQKPQPQRSQLLHTRDPATEYLTRSTSDVPHDPVTGFPTRSTSDLQHDPITGFPTSDPFADPAAEFPTQSLSDLLQDPVSELHLEPLADLLRDPVSELPNPLLPPPVNPDPVPDVPNDGGYWFGPTSDDQMQIIADPQLLNFIGRLHHGAVALAQKPSGPYATVWTPFLDGEEWNCWFKDVFATTETMSMETKDLQPVTISFGYWPLGRTYVEFRTDWSRRAFGLDHDVLSSTGLVDADVMALSFYDMGNPFSATLANLTTLARQDRIAGNPLLSVLRSVKVDTSFSDPGTRNVVWFEPGRGYRVTERLQWQMDSEPLNSFLSNAGIHLVVSDVAVITRTVDSWRPGAQRLSTGSLTLQATVAASGHAGLSLNGYLTLSGDKGLTLTVSATASAWDAFVAWLSGVIGAVDLGFITDALRDLIDLVSSVVRPRRLTMHLIQHSPGNIVLSSWTLDVELSVKSVPILVTYDSASRILSGEFWPPSTDKYKIFRPEYETFLHLEPLTENPVTTLRLTDLSPSSIAEADIPRGIPNIIQQAGVKVNTSTKAVSFSTSILCEPVKSSATLPAVSLNQVDLWASYSKADVIAVEFYFFVTLGSKRPTDSADTVTDTATDTASDSDDDDDDYDPGRDGAMLRGAIVYSDRSWMLSGSIEGVGFDEMYQLLDPDYQDDVAAVLGHFWLSRLELTYHYGPGGVGSDFSISGYLTIGKIALDMEYKYDAHGWSLKAGLEVDDLKDDVKLRDIIDYILDNTEDDGEILPDFILDIPLAKKGKIASISCTKRDKKTGQTVPLGASANGQHFILLEAVVNLGVVSVGFAHYRDLAKSSTDPPKRVFKLSMNGLPPIKIETLELPQPFDELAYVWVQDKANPDSPGLTEAELDIINTGMRSSGAVAADGEDWLRYRDTRKPGTTSVNDTVMPAGSHFMIIANLGSEKRVVLDYTLGIKKRPQTKDSTISSSRDMTGTSAMAAMKKVVGAVTIANIGLKYENKTLSFLLDASFLLGPIGFTLIGASIGIDLSKHTILSITPADLSFGLSGLAVAFDEPPLRLGGIFVHKETKDISYYAGGIVVGLDPYEFVAAGMYGTIETPVEYETAFVFAKLEGPLITLEFAEISGITAGFGYNDDVKLPTIETVRQFPFLSGSEEASGSLLDYLGRLVKTDGTGFFQTRPGAMWLAAGLKVSAFEMLDVDAVFVVSWQPAVSIGIYGVGTADIPKAAAGSRAFSHVELGILAVLDLGAGVFKVEAQLSPSSYIFDPGCRLTGGFALYYWFNNKVPDRAGEWVFTLGGYHRAFSKPDYYPEPPRLGIHWQVSDVINILGEAYFAVTPKSCMAGGRLEATLHAGPLRAWFSAWADFLINYMPFDFTGQVSVDVGVSLTIDLLFTSYALETHAAAQLDLMGPPFRGRLTVHCWVATFHVNFGPDETRDAPPDLQKFYNMVLQAGQPQALAAAFASGGRDIRADEKSDGPHVFTCRGGILDDESKLGDVKAKAKDRWHVKANDFVFAVDARFALTSASVEPPREIKGQEGLTGWESPSQEALYAKPMEVTHDLTSELVIDIVPLATNQQSVSDKNWRVTPIMKEVPSALWGKYNIEENPRQTGRNDIKDLLDGSKGTLSKLMGVSILPPEPNRAADKIGAFDAVKAMELDVFKDKEDPTFGGFDDADPWLYPARSTYDEVREIWTDVNVGGRSNDILLLGKALGWDAKSYPVGDTPKRLVRDLGSLYMACPQVTVS